MKWPEQIVFVRHAESTYNILKSKLREDELYKTFKACYEQNYLDSLTRQRAEQIRQKFALKLSDAETPITIAGEKMAHTTGAALKKMVRRPHVIFVSPYLRTMLTLNLIKAAWPELRRVKVVPDDRIREQEHGLALLYNDWRVFHAFHPEQKELRDLQGPYWYQFPQGESVSQVRDRIRSFLITLTREYSGQRVLVVTHHLTILSFRSILERLPPHEFIQLDEFQKPINCGVTVYDGRPDEGKDGRLNLACYNKKLY